ncbi:MAG: ABC transporter permease [Alphaproteobacteria bacterium]
MKRILKNYLIIKALSLNELKVKYKRNVLGFFWSLLNPILNISLISIVFSKIMEMSYKDFVLFLTPAIMAWNLFVNIINSCSNCLIYNERLIRNTNIDKFIFPLVSTTTTLVDFFLAFTSLLTLYFLLFFAKIHIAIFIIPFSILLLTIFAFSIGTIISIVNIYFRDIGYIVNVLLQILFFLTPILYQKSRLGTFVNLAKINPMLHFIDLFRDPIYYGNLPSSETFLITAAWSLGMFLVSYNLLNKLKDQIIFRL